MVIKLDMTRNEMS